MIRIKFLKVSPIEESVLKIANELVKNRPLDIELLYSKSIDEIKNYSKNEISHAIYQLILKNYIVEGSKITKDTVFQNNTRYRIYKYVYNKPGAHSREIRKNLNISPRLIAWHLKILEKFDYIKKNKITNKIAYFHSKINPEFYEGIFILRDPRHLEILELILSEPGISLGLLGDKSGLKLGIIRNAIQTFSNLNYINQKYQEGEIRYFGNLEHIEPIMENLRPPPLEIKPPYIKGITPPIEKEKIKILREFDYIGGNIRFKVAVRNESSTTISKIGVILTPTTQYRINNRIQEIDVLNPGESRGVDFNLIPLTCGQSQIFGSISYVDAFGNPKMLPIIPKEIQIKCPLVTPQKATKSDIDTWKKTLLKGATKIQYSNIPNSQAFKIASEQVSALDLAEVETNFDEMTAVFSGVAKVTGNSMIVEIKIINSNISLEVWTADMKQATGFIAYIKNLINVALETAQSLQTKIEKISQSILDSFDISERLCKCFEICEEREVVKDIVLLLREIVSRIEGSLPESDVIGDIINSLTQLEKLPSSDNLDDKSAVKLESYILQWMKEILKIIQTNSKTYRDTFQDQEIAVNTIEEQTKNLNLIVSQIEQQYSLNILKYLMVINQNSGLTMFNHNFGGFEFDTDLISGFLTAIQSFGSEISKGATPVKKLAYKDFEIVMEDGQYIRAAIVLTGPVTSFLSEKLLHFISVFEAKYANDIVNWTGNVGIFKELISKMDDLFK